MGNAYGSELGLQTRGHRSTSGRPVHTPQMSGGRESYKNIAPCRLQGTINAPLIRFLISALYIYCLLVYIVCFPLIFFSSLFPYLSLPLPVLIFSLTTDLLRFQAGCRKRRRNLALVFLCLFCAVVHFFWLVNACFCCVRFRFFPNQTTTQSINQSSYRNISDIHVRKGLVMADPRSMLGSRLQL